MQGTGIRFVICYLCCEEYNVWETCNIFLKLSSYESTAYIHACLYINAWGYVETSFLLFTTNVVSNPTPLGLYPS